MLLVLIPIAWLTIIAIVVNACRGAARGDAIMAQATWRSDERAPIGARLPWSEGPALTGRRHLDRASGSRAALRGTRDRGGRCAAN
jgi:hypothetical protein